MSAIQTVLLIASPFLLPKAITLFRRFMNPRPAGSTRTSLNPSYHPPLPAPTSPPHALFRLLLFSLALSLSLFTALSPPTNIFLSLSTPHSLLSTLIPIFRTPLDLRLATETLSRLWSQRLSRPLLPDELALLGRLQTLDSRIAYIAFGTAPLMTCTWCRTGGGQQMDYLILIAPNLMLLYLLATMTVGMLLSGDRSHWRKWLVGALVVGGVMEAYMRASWRLPRGGEVVMLHSQLHVLRHTYFGIIILISYFLPTRSIPQLNSTATIISPGLSAIAQQAENLIHQIRVTSIQRTAVLHHEKTRSKVVQFWSNAEKESALARADPALRVAAEGQLETTVGPFKAWLEEALKGKSVEEVVENGGVPSSSPKDG